MTLSRLAAVGAAVVLSVTLPGCTGGSGTPTPSESATTPTPSPSSTPIVTPSATPPPAQVYTFGDEGEIESADGAQGSGCSPGPGLVPDGAWFGYMSEWSTSQIAFDLACWWDDPEAEAQAAARGEDYANYYISNDNTDVRFEPVAGDIPAKRPCWEDAGPYPLSEVITALETGNCPVDYPYPVWVFVNGGVVTELEVLYLG